MKHERMTSRIALFSKLLWKWKDYLNLVTEATSQYIIEDWWLIKKRPRLFGETRMEQSCRISKNIDDYKLFKISIRQELHNVNKKFENYSCPGNGSYWIF